MKFNNKTLGIIFIALLAIIFFRKMVNQPEVRSFREVLVAVDTAAVSKIILTKGTENKIELLKENGAWTASSNGKTFPATNNSIQGVLSSIVTIKPQQLISKKREKWADYELDEATGKKVEIYSNGKLLDSFYAGRFNFNQQSRSAKTYFRKADEDDVYSVDGFLSMTFDKKLDDFRNKKLFDGLQKEQIKSIAFDSKGGNRKVNFTNGQWMNEMNQPLDSTKVENYISRLINRSGSEFDDTFVENLELLEANIQLRSETETPLAELKIYNEVGKTKPFVFSSSLNEGVYFRSDSSGLFQNLVKGLEELF